MKPKYYIQDLDNYTSEHLINIILFLDSQIKEANELIEKGAWSSAREKLKV